MAPSFQKISHSSKLQDANMANGYFLQNETGPPIKDGPLLIKIIIRYHRKKSSRLYSTFLQRILIRHT